MASHPAIRLRPRPAIPHQRDATSIRTPDEGGQAAAPPDSPKSNYNVGYGKPPLATRFGGPRGNRSGRRKGSRDRNTIIREELDTKVEVAGHGKLSKYRLALRQLANQAAKGDLKAIIAVHRLAAEMDRAEQVQVAQQASLAEQAAMIEPAEISAAGQAVLELFAEEIRASQSAFPDATSTEDRE